jgi:hypothetical protein
MSKSRILGAALAALAVLLAMPCPAPAQAARFVAFGGGAGVPVGGTADAMSRGWIAEAMGGITVSDGVIGLRLGAMYAYNHVSMPVTPDEAMMLDADPLARSSRKLGFMAGGMYMPLIVGPTVPYLLADAGVMRARYEDSATSLIWQAGAGTIVQLGSSRLYVEARLLQARRGARHGEMVPITAGIRFGR